MTWFVLRSPAGKWGVAFSVIRPTNAVAGYEDYAEAVREKVRMATEETVGKMGKGRE